MATDEDISEVLREVIERPVFINLQHSSSGENVSSILQPTAHQGCEVEFVGSSSDGLKTSRCFDVGDYDVLVYANVTFTADDEATFEYRKDNPLFFHIPLPKSVCHLKPLEGKYLNPRLVRLFDRSFFGSMEAPQYHGALYTVIHKTVQRSDYKCATTEAIPYADPVTSEADKAPEHYMDQRLYFMWCLEHALFSYVLNKSVGEKIDFIRELLYDKILESSGDVEFKTKKLLAFIKEDIQRMTVNTVDIIYFKSEHFMSLLQRAVDTNPERLSKIKPHGEFSTDFVPAIRCKSWPKPASNFIARERVWPDKDVIREIVEEGFRVVPKTSILDPIPEKDFILSFSHADVKLVRLLPQEARTAYCLLKMCYKSCSETLKDGNTLKTYHLKQALLWVAEVRAPDSWIDASPLQCLRWICEFLLKVLTARFFPSFYVEGSNHICHFTDTDCEKHIKLFSEIHRNPVNYVKVVIDQEWEICEATMCQEWLLQLQLPGYFSSFTSQELLKIYMNAIAGYGGYQLDELFDQLGKGKDRELYGRLVGNAFDTQPPHNMPMTSAISDSQLKHVEIFVKTVTQSDMDLFGVLDFQISDDVRKHELHWLPTEILEKYPQIQQESPEVFGEHILMTLRLRLKYYGNIFHMLCNMLFTGAYGPETNVRNHDAGYIIRFLKLLIAKKHFNDENIQDLLHYLFYFCHFTRLRHHSLTICDQILRSMREFLQDARTLMTVYFNPRILMPCPVDVGDKIEEVLGQCYL